MRLSAAQEGGLYPTARIAPENSTTYNVSASPEVSNGEPGGAILTDERAFSNGACALVKPTVAF